MSEFYAWLRVHEWAQVLIAFNLVLLYFYINAHKGAKVLNRESTRVDYAVDLSADNAESNRRHENYVSKKELMG